MAPVRSEIDPVVFTRPPLSQWLQFGNLLCGREWPDLDALNACCPPAPGVGSMRFVAQSPALLADGLHYEQRIAGRGDIATREHNWHDLLNALVWLRFAPLKSVLNARQVAQIAIVGPKTRTRAQCALTLFDEAGVVVLLRDAALLSLWDAHDWHGLFWRERSAWSDGRIEAIVFGHALLEHALKNRQLLVGKALVVTVPQSIEVEHAASADNGAAIDAVVAGIRSEELLLDPQELRPLPMSGIPGWHEDNASESFYRSAPCFCPARAGRDYPAPLSLRHGGTFGRVVSEPLALHAVAPAGAVVAGDAESAGFAATPSPPKPDLEGEGLNCLRLVTPSAWEAPSPPNPSVAPISVDCQLNASPVVEEVGVRSTPGEGMAPPAPAPPASPLPMPIKWRGATETRR
ncbi:MAG TPA: DUF3025 domain-containing protein [Rudaea sp.]